MPNLCHCPKTKINQSNQLLSIIKIKKVYINLNQDKSQYDVSESYKNGVRLIFRKYDFNAFVKFYTKNFILNLLSFLYLKIKGL